MDFQKATDQAIEKNNSLLCVGFDPVLEKIPEFLQKEQYPFFAFNKEIINATVDLVCSYKFNSAFYEARGAQGITELKLTCDYLKKQHPHIPIILDAKRGDIGSTNQAYAQFAFDYIQADALTVMPYMGIESLRTFFDYEGRGIILGCHSSNEGSADFQELEINGKPLYQIVAEKLIQQYGDNPNAMIFMGATFPQTVAQIRQIIGDKTILSPGVGAQQGNLEKTVKEGINSKKKGLLVVAVRSIIYASQSHDFADKARQQALVLRDAINTARA